MLIPVKYGEVQKYVMVTQSEDGNEDFHTFHQKGNIEVTHQHVLL